MTAHEDRLQRLETEHQIFSNEQSKHGIQLIHLAAAIKEGFMEINEKIDGLVRPLYEKVDAQQKIVESAVVRIATFQADKEETTKNWGLVKKAVWMGGIGVMSILGERFVLFCIDKFTKH